MLTLKKYIYTLFLLFAISALHGQPALPDIMLKTIRGTQESFSTITKSDSIVLICFWSTVSDQSVSELNAINAQYEKWKKTTSFKMMAVAIDEGKLSNRVKSFANMNAWAFDVYTDVNGDMKSTLKVNTLPESFILKNGKVVYQQSGFEKGTETYLIEKIWRIAAKN